MKSSASTKLMSSVGLLVGLALVVGLGALVVNARLGALLQDAVNEKARLRYVASVIGNESTEMVAAERGLAFAMMLQQTQQADAMRARFARSEENFLRLAKEYTGSVKTGSGSSEATALLANFEVARQHHSELRTLMEQQKMDDAIKMLNEKLLPELASLSESSKKLAEIQGKEIDNLRDNAETTKSAGFWIMLALNLVALVVGAGVFWMVRGLTSTLRRTVSELSESSQHLANTSKEVGTYSLSLSRSASEQAASLEETSASTEEIHSMTRSNADNSKQAAARMEEASHRVEDASRALAEMVNSMTEISTSSGKISKIIKVIDEIAFQTNILALNAAVEAARAGEAGMGFAVVADEVRNLAQRSAQAAKDTTQLIEESIQSANKGKLKLDEVAKASSSVNELVKTVAALVQEVRLGSEEQERGIEQIAKAVSQMERVTQQVAANAEEGAAAGEELKRHASTVERTVDALKSLVGQEEASGFGFGASAGGGSATEYDSRKGFGRSLDSLRAATGSEKASIGGSSFAKTSTTKTPVGAGVGTKPRTIDKNESFPMDSNFEEF